MKNNNKQVNEELNPSEELIEWHYRDENGEIQFIDIPKGNLGLPVERDIVPDIISKVLYKRVEGDNETYSPNICPHDSMLMGSATYKYAYQHPTYHFGLNYPINKESYVRVGNVLINARLYRTGKIAVLKGFRGNEDPKKSNDYLIVNLESKKYVEVYNLGNPSIDLRTGERDGYSFLVIDGDGGNISCYAPSFYSTPTAPIKIVNINENGNDLKINRKRRVFVVDSSENLK